LIISVLSDSAEREIATNVKARREEAYDQYVSTVGRHRARH
jgi:hypothetical protein